MISSQQLALILHSQDSQCNKSIALLKAVSLVFAACHHSNSRKGDCDLLTSHSRIADYFSTHFAKKQVEDTGVGCEVCGKFIGRLEMQVLHF